MIYEAVRIPNRAFNRPYVENDGIPKATGGRRNGLVGLDRRVAKSLSCEMKFGRSCSLSHLGGIRRRATTNDVTPVEAPSTAL